MPTSCCGVCCGFWSYKASKCRCFDNMNPMEKKTLELVESWDPMDECTNGCPFGSHICDAVTDVNSDRKDQITLHNEPK